MDLRKQRGAKSLGYVNCGLWESRLNEIKTFTRNHCIICRPIFHLFFFFFYLFIFLFFQLDWVEKLSYLTVLATELRDEITCEQPTKAVIILHEQGFTQLWMRSWMEKRYFKKYLKKKSTLGAFQTWMKG